MADFNRAAYERLKPGGYYVIVDHAADAGAGTSDTPSLHRIDPATVRALTTEAVRLNGTLDDPTAAAKPGRR